MNDSLPSPRVSPWTELVPGVLCRTDACHVYAVVNGARAVLVNVGDGSALSDLPPTVRHVDAVLLTHGARDVAEGAARAAELGIPVFAPEAGVRAVGNDLLNEYDPRAFLPKPTRGVETRSLRPYRSYTFGGVEAAVLPTPGAAPNALSFQFTVNGRRVIFCGDLVSERGRLPRLAPTQWTYTGGEGLAGTILSLLDLADRAPDVVLPAHGSPLGADDLRFTAERVWELVKLRGHNPRLLELRERPYEELRPWLLVNRTSCANSTVLKARSGRAVFIDFGYDFAFGQALVTTRESRVPWLYTLPDLFEQHGVTAVEAVIPTHFHDDHVAGIPLLRETFGSHLWAPENFADILARPEQHRLPCLWFEPMAPDRVLPLGRPFVWEEFTITLFEYPGHTRFAVAILVEAHGERLLFVGDQYGLDARFLNYTYANGLREHDFADSADLIERLAPDLVFGGHHAPIKPTREWLADLKGRGARLRDLHATLQPSSSRLLLHVTPIRARLGDVVTVKVENPTPDAFHGELITGGASSSPVLVPPHGSFETTFTPTLALTKIEVRGAPGDPPLCSHVTLGEPA